MPITERYTCEYCGKSAAKKATIERHYDNCRIYMRYQIRSLEEVQIAYRLWKAIQFNNSNMDIEHFERSNLYKTFIDFVVYMSDTNGDFELIQDYGFWLLKNKVSVYHWKKNTFYNQFISSYVNSELPRDGILRSISNIEKTGCFSKFFKSYPVGNILTMIETGKISPWIIILSDSGTNFINRLEGEKINFFCKLINLDRWNNKRQRYEKTCRKLIDELKGIEI